MNKPVIITDLEAMAKHMKNTGREEDRSDKEVEDISKTKEKKQKKKNVIKQRRRKKIPLIWITSATNYKWLTSQYCPSCLTLLIASF